MVRGEKDGKEVSSNASSARCQAPSHGRRVPPPLFSLSDNPSLVALLNYYSPSSP